jgi:hypothetical protein
MDTPEYSPGGDQGSEDGPGESPSEGLETEVLLPSTSRSTGGFCKQNMETKKSNKYTYTPEKNRELPASFVVPPRGFAPTSLITPEWAQVGLQVWTS